VHCPVETSLDRSYGRASVDSAGCCLSDQGDIFRRKQLRAHSRRGDLEQPRRGVARGESVAQSAQRAEAQQREGVARHPPYAAHPYRPRELRQRRERCPRAPAALGAERIGLLAERPCREPRGDLRQQERRIRLGGAGPEAELPTARLPEGRGVSD